MAAAEKPKRIFEGRAIWASHSIESGWIKLFERGTGIEIDAPVRNVQLTPREAKCLADRLYELAQRVEAA